MRSVYKSADILVQCADTQENSPVDPIVQLPSLDMRSSRPLYAIRQKDITVLQESVKDESWFLLPTMHATNMMYLCDSREYDEKISKYFAQINPVYASIAKFRQSDVNETFHAFIAMIVTSIQRHLKALVADDLLTLEQYQQWMPHTPCPLRFNSMVFLPDTRLETVPFRPQIIDVSGFTTHIVRHLHGMLRTCYCLAAQTTTFHDVGDAVHKMEKYASEGLLQPTTRFVTIDIDDFENDFDHEEMLIVLQQFLRDHVGHQQTSDLSHEAILSLVRLVLQTQYCTYDNQLYRQTKGANSEWSLTKLLIDIYLLYWQTTLVEVLHSTGEAFGRNYTQVIFTWNDTEHRLQSLLTTMTRKHPNLAMHYDIGFTVTFRGADFTTDQGRLRTQIGRLCLTEPYAIPYLTAYPTECYQKIIRRLLVRAIRCCTDVSDYYNEHKFIYIVCMLNRFPLDLLDDLMRQVFREFSPLKTDTRYTQRAYEKLRRRVIESERLPVLPKIRKRSAHVPNTIHPAAAAAANKHKRRRTSSP